MHKSAFLLPLLLVVSAHPVLAAPAKVAAAIAAPNRPADFRKLDGSRKPVAVLNFLGLKEGDRALEMFADRGYYAALMADAVGPKGSVVGWNPDGFTDDKMRAGWEGLKGQEPNASFLVSQADAIALPADSFDFVMFHLAYHDLYWESSKYNYPRTDPAAVLAKVYAALKPGGIVGVIDHVAEPGGDTRATVEKLHRIDPAVVKADFERAGFVLEKQSPLLRNAADDHSKEVTDPAIRGNTDRILYRFRKPR